MTWKSSEELTTEARKFEGAERLAALYGLSKCWDDAIYPEDYRANDAWASMLTLSSSGAQYVDSLKGVADSFPAPDFNLALFAKFFHHDLFFDWLQSDINAVRELLETELLSQRIRYPSRFGRSLYDRFNDLQLTDRTDHLLSADVPKLIDGTPQGVYQVNHILLGPLGVLDSAEVRWIPPSLSLPLWHCSDTGCQAVHNVGLIPPQIECVKAYQAIFTSLNTQLGPASEWIKPLKWLLQERKFPSGRKYYDLVTFIADCILDSDRASLLESALTGDHGATLRAIIGSPPRTERHAYGSAIELVSRLSPEEQHQLLLTLPDQDLVSLIDSCIAQDRIRIPLGQIRRAKQTPPRITALWSTTEVSSLGMRSVRSNPLVNLFTSIVKAYEETDSTSELEWRLRASSGLSMRDALSAYIRAYEPSTTIAELVLSSQKVTEHVCRALNIAVEALTRNEKPVERLLWKLGFHPPQFETFIDRFRVRLANFIETLLATTPIQTEDDRERIRASGVNLFVSVEDFLDRIISYNLWVLASDHFVETRFVFRAGDARRVVQSIMGESLESGDQVVSWNVMGENPLGTLLRYLRESTGWMKSLEDRDRGALAREASDLPHFAQDTIRRFPFGHTELWADSELHELRRYVDGYCTIVKLIEQANLASIRNGLDHSRDPSRFPTGDSMLASATRLREAVELADVNRYIPKVFWLQSRSQKRFGSQELVFQDYSKRSVIYEGPRMVSGFADPGFKSPYLIASANLLGASNSLLLFTMREDDNYEQYWKGFPKRRHLPSKGTDEAGKLLEEPLVDLDLNVSDTLET